MTIDTKVKIAYWLAMVVIFVFSCVATVVMMLAPMLIPHGGFG